MAWNLSKRVTPTRSRPQHTFRRETTMPRQDTRREDLGVFADIHRPDTSNADALTKLLGIAADVGTNIAGDIQEGKDKEAAAQADLDFTSGDQDEEMFAKSRAYRASWQKQGAKKVARDVSAEMGEVYADLFNDPADPPTVEEVNAALEGVIGKHILDERGELLDFGTPEAKTILANAVSEAKATAMAKAYADVGKAQDIRFLNTALDNQLFEWDRGAPVGAEVDVELTDGGDYDRDDLAPLPEREGSSEVLTGKPTGRPPAQGAVTSTFSGHRKRGSAGVDIDGKIGDPVEAPAGGKVSVGRNSRSGLFVEINHGGGIVSTYSHLSGTDLKDGMVIQAGQTLGLMGNSGNVRSSSGGDGSHLHWRVKVNGKDVDPLAYQFPGETRMAVTNGAEPELLAELPQQSVAREPFPFEALMAELPPSIHKGEAKAYFLEQLLGHAKATGDVSVLAGLEDSVRKDGSPSFRPTERAQIEATRDAVLNKVRIENDRKERELQSENRDRVLQAYLDGNEPPQEWFREQARLGLLDEDFAVQMVRAREQEEAAAERDARALVKEAEREARENTMMGVYAQEAAFRAGLLDGGTYGELLSLWKSGALGEGKFGAANFKRLQAAAKAGRTEAEKNPQFSFYSRKLQTEYAPAKQGNGSSSLFQMPTGGRLSEPEMAAMLAHYEQQVHSGESPEAAYRSAVSAYAKKGGDTSAAMNRMAYLRCKRSGQCN